jgi:class 3 adenylate cyclase
VSFADGRYTVKSFLGEGGRKRVYLAHDSKLDRDVAIAVIKTEGLDAGGLVRVRREAQAMGRLGDHPHVVVVHDVGEDEGQPYIVSRYMAGGSVEEQLANAEGHRLPIDQALRTAEQVSLALDHAHKNGIIHRDLKPGNVWLTAEGTAMLGDFGLAMALDRSRMTAHGMMVGTVAYMPPEQALGRTPNARSDLYSLGATLYEMVTGRPPFLGDDAVGVISQHINTAPVDPSWHNPEVRGAVEDLILRLLAKSPADRPETASAVAVQLRRIIAAGAQEAPPEPVPDAAAGQQAGIWGRFVGRRDEMEQLKAALEAVLSGHGSLVMVVGEPGIGKSRLAREFTVYASLRGAQVLTGHCYEGEITVPYLPFVEALRQYVRGRSDAALLSELGSGAPEVAKLVSEVRERFPDLPEAAQLEGEAERLRLFDSVTRFVCSVSTSDPVVLFLDDIHWADKPSLLLLQYLARNIRSDRILVLAAYRDVELDRTHPLSEMLASLRRERLFERVLLRGLPAGDVFAMISAVGQQSAGPEQPVTSEFAQAVYRETEGNPFFVEEVLKHLVDEGKIYREGGVWVRDASVEDLGIPEGVREVLGRRLSRLSEPCNRMLSLASTMTGGFSFDVLLSVSGEEEAQLLDLLDEALRALVIRERSGPGAGIYEFNHALMRQTLYAELNTPRRVRLHRQVGEAMERVHAANLEPHLPALAHHFFQAAPGGDVDKAIDYATQAAQRAISLTAYEEAARLYDIALQAHELKGRPDESQRCELLLALGEAHNKAGDRDRAKEVFLRASDTARKLRDAVRLARAAIGFGGPPWAAFGASDEPLVHLLEEALEAIGADESALRARMLGRLAMDAFFANDMRRAQEVSAEAIEVARKAGDAIGLADALWSRFCAFWGEGGEEQSAAARELVKVSEEAGDTERQIWGHFTRYVVLFQAGDAHGTDGEVEHFARLAEELRRPVYYGWTLVYRASRAVAYGRYAEAERLIEEILPLAGRSQDETMIEFRILLLAQFRREQGRLQEAETLYDELGERFAAVPAWRAPLAHLYCDMARKAEARDEFDRLAADGFTGVLDSVSGWSVAAVYLAETCARLNDQSRAEVLYEALLPYAGRNPMLGPLANDSAVSRHLGVLATVTQRWDEAERHFEDALAMNIRMEAQPGTAWTRYQYADMVLRRNADGDRKKALSLLAQALDTAQKLGMKLLTERALALKLKAQGIEGSDLLTSIDTVAKEVLAVQPDLRPHAAPDGTVTIMFSDIEGSTVLTERLGDQRWMELLREHNAIVRNQVKSHGGFEVKSEGDGFMVAFQSAGKALACASAVQRELVERNQSAGEPVLVRVGLHAGEVIKEGEDFFGRNVIMAARVASKAQGGEILASGVLKALLAGSDVSWGEKRTVELKGLSGKHEIWAVNWSE